MLGAHLCFGTMKYGLSNVIILSGFPDVVFPRITPQDQFHGCCRGRVLVAGLLSRIFRSVCKCFCISLFLFPQAASTGSLLLSGLVIPCPCR